MVACPLCGGSSHRPLCQMHGTLFGTHADVTLCRCDCGLVITNPQPYGETLARFYAGAKYYTHCASTRSTWREQLRRFQMRGVGASLRIWLETHTECRRFMKSLAPDAFTLNPGMRMLDYGCGSGDILRLAADVGLLAEGVEPDPHARAVALGRGCVVYNSVETLIASARMYDRVLIRHVLEHLPDPIRVLRWLSGLLAPNGRVLISVPNIESRQAQDCSDRWIGFDAPRHLWHFSPRTLSKAVRTAGLQPIHLSTVERFEFLQPAPSRGKRPWSAKRVESEMQGCEIVLVAQNTFAENDA